MGQQSSSLRSCGVCSKEATSGLRCNAANHLVCSLCLSSYATSYCEASHSLCSANGFVIRCPRRGCKSFLWRYAPMLAVPSEGSNSSSCRGNNDDGSSDILECYVDSLLYLAIVTLNRPSVSYYFRVALALRILRALALHCPSCGVVMTKGSRGGCVAVECGQCGTHFCWLCFKVNSDLDTCRAHALLCHQNPFKVLYPPVYCVQAAHRTHRVKFIRLIIEEVERECSVISKGLRIEADFCGGCLSASEVKCRELVYQLVGCVLKELQPVLRDNGIAVRIN